MSAHDEPSYLAFARAAARNGEGASATILRELVARIDRDASSRTTPTVVHVHHDTEAHARSFNEGYETAMAQELADDPTIAGDWLDEKLATAWDEGRQAGHDHMIGKQSSNPYRSEA